MDFAFVLKKLIVSALVPPGILVILCLAAAFLAGKKAKPFLVSLALVTYLVSITPVADMALRPLERIYAVPSLDGIRACDAYVVLGGGINRGAPSLHGKGMPEDASLFRAVAAYEAYRLSPKPIIISGGSLTKGESEAEVTKRFLLGLGVREEHLITETTSRDTDENARNTGELCRSRGLNRILLITSAFHMKRSMLLFRTFTGRVTPFPAGYKGHDGSYSFFDFLPHGDNIDDLGSALKEYIGLLYYRITR